MTSERKVSLRSPVHLTGRPSSREAQAAMAHEAPTLPASKAEFPWAATETFINSAAYHPISAASERAMSAYLQYRLANTARERKAMRLYLAIRPFQVNPPWQFLNTPGGVATIRQIESDGQVLRVNGETVAVSLTPPNGFGAATFDQGNVVEERYLGPDGRLTEDRHRGVAIVRWAYDRRGLMTEERYFGPDETPKEDRLRKAAMVRWVYDVNGRVLDTYLYDRTGAPITTGSR